MKRALSIKMLSGMINREVDKWKIRNQRNDSENSKSSSIAPRINNSVNLKSTNLDKS